MVETGRVVNVNIADWTVDVVMDKGGKRHPDILVNSPYLHYQNGEGVYVVPEVGAVCWVCTPSEGDDAQEFILGFQPPMQGTKDFSAGRPDMNPGDIMLRTRDENFLILRRGGVVQIGATPTSQRMYIPVRNFIRDFAENYELLAFGGSMQWLVGDDRLEDGPPEYGKRQGKFTTFQLLAKEKANDPGHVVDLTIGSHGEGDPTTLSIVARASGAEGAAMKVELKVTKEGDVSWDVQKDWSMSVQGNHTTMVKGDLALDVSGKIHQQSRGNGEYIANGNMLVRGDGDTTIKGGTKVDVDAPFINLGGASASFSAVLGEQLNSFLTALLGHIDSLQCPSAPLIGAGSLPVVSLTGPVTPKMVGQLPMNLSNTVKVKQ
jgi:hypothetical protein